MFYDVSSHFWFQDISGRTQERILSGQPWSRPDGLKTVLCVDVPWTEAGQNMSKHSLKH